MPMSEPNYRVVVTDQDNAEAGRTIETGLAEYNREMAGYVDARPLSVHVTDAASRQVVGGLSGRTSLGLFFIDLFFLPQALRGHRLGTEIIEAAEAEAKRRGCSTAVLYTITFQAPGFYERRGYRVLGRIECPPPGYTRICMTKTL
jgi:GNAT superfamily N-acetyltransferase